MKIKHLDLTNDKNYIYVLSMEYLDNYKNTIDLSIFNIEEWEHLITLSKYFERAFSKLKASSDYELKNTDAKIIKASNYFYYSPYTYMYSGLSKLEYKIATNIEIYEKSYNIIKTEEYRKITLNNFREWIIENYKDIISNYELLQKY